MVILCFDPEAIWKLWVLFSVLITKDLELKPLG